MISKTFFAVSLALGAVFSAFISEKKAAAPLAENTETALPIDTTRTLTTIAFGSCNKLDQPQGMLGVAASNKPDAWIWLGDIIYADTRDMKKLTNMYRALKMTPDHKKLAATAQILGVYDDHDYGENDACRYYPMKKESRDALFGYLEVPQNSYLRKREGAYQSYLFGKKGQQTRVILMDLRYFRDSLIEDPDESRRYFPNEDGTMLGDAQWKWLEKELSKTDAQLTVLGSSVQVVANDHGHEKWGNFPGERTRLLNLISKTKPKNLIILSGDRHMAEVSRCSLPGLPYYLYDVTSSGLTHIRTSTAEPNKFRSGDMIVKKNFGLLKIDWTGPKPTVNVTIRGEGNTVFLEEKIKFELK